MTSNAYRIIVFTTERPYFLMKKNKHVSNRVLVYNPTCELAVQHDTLNYQPPKQLIEFEKQLAPLMIFLAKEGDSLVCDRPKDDVLSFWASKGVSIPHFIGREEARRQIADGATLRPWGMSREVLYRFGGHALADSFTSEHRQLFSRLSSVALDERLSAIEMPDIFVQAKRPFVVRDEQTLKAVIEEGPCVIKSLWSASGRGVSIVNRQEFRAAALSRYAGSIRRDGAVVVEPLLNREIDMAMLFNLNADGKVDYLGNNFYRSDSAGRFGVELIGQDPIRPYVERGEFPRDGVDMAADYLCRAIESMGWHEMYAGAIGVDSMLYRDDEGRLKMRLCIEANIRYTMGNVNLAIAKCFPQGVEAEWGIETGRDVLDGIKAVLDSKDH